MKMMQRPVAVADLQLVGGGDGRGDVGLGLLHGAARDRGPWRARRRSPTTACSRCRGCSWWRCAWPTGAPRTSPCPISRSTLSSPLAVAALDQHLARAERQQSRAPALPFPRSLRARLAPVSAAASGRLGVTTSARGISRRAQGARPRRAPAAGRRRSPPSPDRARCFSR